MEIFGVSHFCSECMSHWFSAFAKKGDDGENRSGATSVHTTATRQRKPPLLRLIFCADDIRRPTATMR